MGRISSSVGLISGLNITDTVDQLIKVASTPKTILESRTKDLKNEQLALNTLSGKLLSLQYDIGKLTGTSLYQAKSASSSDANLLNVSVKSGGTPVAANYQFTPVRQASAQQFVSQRFDGLSTSFEAQSFSFRKGGFVSRGISLDELNGGSGVRRGQIRITDKNGDDAVIDLRYATTVDDVLAAINSNTDINVTADVVGDQIRLTDNTGQSGTLSVQEVSGGKTATDLGLVAITASGATTVATGSDVFTLHTGTRLSTLNDGNGVYFTDNATNIDDLEFTLADGTSAGVDLSGASTLADAFDAIENDADLVGKISVAIAADGNRLEVTDLTSGSGTFSIVNGVLGTAAEDLGLTTTAVAGVITGERLVSGLSDTLLSSLNGGTGIETLGDLNITNRAGVASVVNLSNAETLSGVIDAINNQATGVVASLNDSGSGILLTDTTGATASNLIVASGGGATVAADLHIAVNAAVTTVDSGSLNRQGLSEATFLSAVNGGQGITTLGDISITDTQGVTKVIDLNKVGEEVQTVGDVIDAINASTIGVLARINDTGDGIVLIDTAGGTGKISVKNSSGTTASDLHLVGTSTEVDIEGVPTQVLDSSTRREVAIEDGATLEEIVDQINELNAGVSASIVNDGQGYRLSLAVTDTGRANELLLELGNTDFQFEEVSAAQDAILQFGGASSTGGILVTSADNDFNSVVDGLNLTVTGASTSPVTVAVAKNDDALVAAVQTFVDSYNSLRDDLVKLTDFDSEQQTTGLLFGTNEALRVDIELSRLLTDTFRGLGSFESLQEIGINLIDFEINQDGKLELDTSKLEAAFADDPTGLEKLFADETNGVVARFDSAIDRLAGDSTSTSGVSGLLTNRSKTLETKIKTNEDKIEELDAYLERERERLLLQFYALEEILAGFQQTQSALDSLRPLSPLVSTSSR
jgi:flagellar hook-associated protein 2